MKDILYAEWREDKQAYRLYEPYEPYRTITHVDDKNLNFFEDFKVIVQWSRKDDVLSRIKMAVSTQNHAKKKLESYPFSGMYRKIYQRAVENERLLRKELENCEKEMNNNVLL